MHEDYIACFQKHAADSELSLHAGQMLLELVKDDEWVNEFV